VTVDEGRGIKEEDAVTGKEKGEESTLSLFYFTLPLLPFPFPSSVKVFFWDFLKCFD